MQGTVKQLSDTQQIAEQVYRLLMNGIQPVPEFPPGKVPMEVAARAMGMDVETLRDRMESREVDLGLFFYSEPKGRRKQRQRNFYVYPKKLYEVTGYIWKGEKE